MEAKDIKAEIHKVIGKVPENLLEDILLYLEEIQEKNKSQVDNSQHLKKILTEDRELLRRLAQ
jgi:Mg2+ and Co2+ transporter CorA